MKTLIKLTFIFILFSQNSICQTNKIYFEYIGRCFSDYADFRAEIKKSEDSLAIIHNDCSTITSFGEGYSVDKNQFIFIDSLLINDDFFKIFQFDEKKDSSLLLKYVIASEYGKFPTGSYLITSYNEKCEINYQYLVPGSEKTKQMFNYLNKKIPFQSKIWQNFIESNLLIVDTCDEYMENNK